MGSVVRLTVFLIFAAVIFVLGLLIVRQTKRLWCGLTVMRKGVKIAGTCSKFRFERWNCGHDVEWLDVSGAPVKRRFNVILFRLKYPCQITVYSYDGAENIGAFEIAKEILKLAAELALFAVLAYGTINMFFIR